MGAEADAPKALRPAVIRHVLANGLTVLILPRHQAPVFSAAIVYKVGGVDEPAGATGIAHMFEHMAFKGTTTVGTTDYRAEAPLLARIDRLRARRRTLERKPDPDPKALAALNAEIATLQDRAHALVIPNDYGRRYLRQGAVGMNATTGAEVTSYFVSLPANRLPFWVAMEADRMAHPVLREFYTERDVILEERRLRVETSPNGLLYERFLAAAFIAHPYGRPTIGWRSDVAGLTRPATRAFFARHYVPANTIITLVGDLDPDQAMAQIKTTFGRLPKVDPVPAAYTVEPPIDGPRRVVVNGTAGSRLMMGYVKPGIHHPDEPVFDVIQIALAEGASGILHQDLVLKRRLASAISVSTGIPGGRDPNLMVISASPRSPHTAAEVETAILERLHTLATEPLAPEILDRARHQIVASLIRSMQSNLGLARFLAYFEAVDGDWAYPFSLPGIVARITPETVMRVARTYLDPERRIVAVRHTHPPTESTP